MDKIRIAIVEDMSDIANYFSRMLSREEDIEIVGVASSGAQGVDLVIETKPDVVLMDMEMEHRYAGVDAIEAIKEALPDTKVVVITIHEDDELLYKAFAAGAVEYIIKTASVESILHSIRAVYNNTLSLRPEISQKLLKEFSRIKSYQQSIVYYLNIVSRLTNAELEVLREMRKGKTYRQVAKDRFVEEVTIRTQVNKILKKFNEHSIKAVIKNLEQLNIFELLESRK